MTERTPEHHPKFGEVAPSAQGEIRVYRGIVNKWLHPGRLLSGLSGSAAWSRMIAAHRCTVRCREKRVDGIVTGVETNRVRPGFGRKALDMPHRLGVEHVDNPWIPDRDVEMPKRGVEELDVRHAAERVLARHGARSGIDHQ